MKELTASIRTWIERWNDDPKPYIWHKTADEILGNLGIAQNLTGSSRGRRREGRRAEDGDTTRVRRG